MQTIQDLLWFRTYRVTSFTHQTTLNNLIFKGPHAILNAVSASVIPITISNIQKICKILQMICHYSVITAQYMQMKLATVEKQCPYLLYSIR